ncbi:acetylserotonin O-methyltransferase [Synechococcus sp. CS-1332]|uniref:acetylserotonin O-methyltransferase n=1 Tax=Synechococcus sp. CS-1332 TaxID=2847972 RepID=UPI00223A7009|nr:acetylserotonin O-methyltransferase [Synechococcus sp. CS-1332]MCT0206375.1 methyltransferase [Synechococcus sp. CS-1332]
MDPNADLTSRFLQLACGNWVTQMLHVAAELAIADHLAAAGPEGLTAEELAGCCGADGEALFRLLRGLASLGLFAESEKAPRRFVLTPLAELLRSDHPGSQRQFVRMLGGEHYDAWADLLHSVRTQESAFRHRYGEPVFTWYGKNPERGAIFDGAMTDFSRVETEGLLAAYDFSGLHHLIDVGGGRGGLAPGGRVLILEQVIAPGNAPAPGKLLDLNMLVMTEGGQERTPTEYGHLLERAGLRLSAIHPTPSPVAVVEAVAA